MANDGRRNDDDSILSAADKTVIGRTLHSVVNDALWSCALNDYMSEEDEEEFNKISPQPKSCIMLNLAHPSKVETQEDDPRHPAVRAAGALDLEERNGTPGIYASASDDDAMLPPVDWLNIPPDGGNGDQVAGLSTPENWDERMQRYRARLRDAKKKGSGIRPGRRGWSIMRVKASKLSKSQNSSNHESTDDGRSRARTRTTRDVRRGRSKSVSNTNSSNRKWQNREDHGVRNEAHHPNSSEHVLILVMDHERRVGRGMATPSRSRNVHKTCEACRGQEDRNTLMNREETTQNDRRRHLFDYQCTDIEAQSLGWSRALNHKRMAPTRQT
eukprot:CAMPEP_0198124900 /NCGR_PEP_ID=MMETSP1442-20131203/41198_1 /TAXON_ID= /ORGANISM="Craspedostauros australis, Strain CCMP3328" /LENGTH=328 /DNA_ID=CAMNT_0043784403 /DNA_START=37 /DNA_END=1024 /DNA_ORIENTATION=-